MKTGIELITEEREEQTKKHGWTPEHDASHNSGQLAMMAACYCAPEQIFVRRPFKDGNSYVDPFPFDECDDKRRNEHGFIRYGTNPFYYGKEEAVKMLARAGALIAAEIDRIQNLKNE